MFQAYLRETGSPLLVITRAGTQVSPWVDPTNPSTKLCSVERPQLCAVLSRSVMSDSFVTPWTASWQAPLSMGILQARILEWVAMLS